MDLFLYCCMCFVGILMGFYTAQIAILGSWNSSVYALLSLYLRNLLNLPHFEK